MQLSRIMNKLSTVTAEHQRSYQTLIIYNLPIINIIGTNNDRWFAIGCSIIHDNEIEFFLSERWRANYVVGIWKRSSLFITGTEL